MTFKEFYLNEDNNITNSSNFVKWFGNSKIVDKEGKPLIVYHGSNNKFSTFNYDNLGTTGRLEGVGFYFTDDKDTANRYGNYLFECYLSIQKPLMYNTKIFSKNVIVRILKKIVELEKSENGIDAEDGFLSNYDDVSYKGVNSVINIAATNSVEYNDTVLDMQSELVNIGVKPIIVNKAINFVTKYDGSISKGFGNMDNSNMTIYVPFFPNQIKSVNNNGNFSGSDNIYE